MANEKAGAGDVASAGVASGQQNTEVSPAPYMKAAVECWGPDGLKWRDGFEHNVVASQGLLHMGNVMFALSRATTNGPFLFVHNATTASGNGWQQIAASVSALQSMCSASYFPAPFSSSAWTTLSTSTTQDFAFTSAASASVSGAGFFFYTSASCATNAATGDIKLYNYGQFANTRTVTQNDTLRVSATLSLATA